MLAKGTPLLIAIPPALLLAAIVAMAMDVLPWAWWSVLVVALLALASALGVGFFRDPQRKVGEGLVAPAHGRVLAVDEDGGRTRISTFMGPFDVHVVRAPLDGRVVREGRRGRGHHRADSQAAASNVALELDFEGDSAPFSVVMISGWFARRIVPYVGVGDRVERGARIGLIRFGSRVDVLVPKDVFEIRVAHGARLVAGTSSMGVRSGARD